VYATNREGGTILGIESVGSIDELPPGAQVDLAFVCTPAGANLELLAACARRGIAAAFITSAGYGEAGEAGRAAERELVAVATELGLVIAGPNGQGVISTPSRLCAQIVAPCPPPGRIGVASQSGNFVSSFQNYAVQTGIGISRAVSAGNAAMVSVPDYLDFFAHDPETTVGLAYVEGIRDGRAFFDRMRTITPHQPLVLLKGGATAAASAPRPPTPARWRATTACSTGCAARRASRARRTWKRRSRRRQRSRPNRSRADRESPSSPPPGAGAW